MVCGSELRPQRRDREGSMPRRRAGQSAREMAREKFAQDPARSLLGRALRVHTEEQAWSAGARGEARLGRRLEKLSKQEWMVLNDLNLSKSGWNVDHLVLGTRGVFVINTKNLTGKVIVGHEWIRVNGHLQNYLHVARSEAKNVQKRLSMAVGREVRTIPALAIYCDQWELKDSPSDVLVRRGGAFPECLLEYPVIMDKREIAPIARAALATGIWDLDHNAIQPLSGPEPPTVAPKPKPAAIPKLMTKRWKKRGKDHVYFKTTEGLEVGYLNVLTGDVMVTNEEFSSIVRDEAQLWLEKGGQQ